MGHTRNKREVYRKLYDDPMMVYDSDRVNRSNIQDEVNDHREQAEQKELTMIQEISNLDDVTGSFYHRELVHLVARLGSMRAVSRELGIPKSSISDTVRKVREHLISKQ